MTQSAGAASRWQRSLALRLVVLYAATTALLLLALGIGLAWLLRLQLEARDLETIDSKSAQVQFVLNELGSAADIDREPGRVAQLAVGHPHIRLALRQDARWLLRPAPPLDAFIETASAEAIPPLPDYAPFAIEHDQWWVRRIEYQTPEGVTYLAYVAGHVSPAQKLLEVMGGTMTIAGVLGVLASAALGWWAARRGLAPIALIASEAERVTADRLGQPLPEHDAPTEVRGLVHAINRMLQRLRESFNSLEEFSADLAHELRTPISNLMLQTQVTLSRPRSADEYREALHSNLAELERLQRMVADMLFLARADRGMFELNSESTDLVQEARDVAEFFEPAAAEADQRIDVGGTACVPCDRLMIRRAITNLISNAVRYSPPGATIRVEAQKNSDQVRLSVENPAPPCTEDELKQMFTRFRRGASAERIDGEGLGLAIVESIMHLHGGRVAADSGAFGIRFSLVFPLHPTAS